MECGKGSGTVATFFAVDLAFLIGSDAVKHGFGDITACHFHEVAFLELFLDQRTQARFIGHGFSPEQQKMFCI
jgi:hypothetical protein